MPASCEAFGNLINEGISSQLRWGLGCVAIYATDVITYLSHAQLERLMAGSTIGLIIGKHMLIRLGYRLNLIIVTCGAAFKCGPGVGDGTKPAVGLTATVTIFAIMFNKICTPICKGY